MSTLNTLLMVLIPVGVAIAMGRLLHAQAGGPSVAIWAAVGTLSTTFWIVAGVFMIVGGFDPRRRDRGNRRRLPGDRQLSTLQRGAKPQPAGLAHGFAVSVIFTQRILKMLETLLKRR
jgi:hypothetical protein